MIWKAWREETIPLIGLVLALVGLFSGHVSILLVGVFFWGLTLLAAQLAHRTLRALTVSSRLAEDYAEIGDVVNTEMIVKNPLPWPILDVQWKIDLPQTVEPRGPGTRLLVPGGSRQTLTGTIWVAGRQRVCIQYQLKGLARGRWNIGPGSLIFRDPLSWNELIREDATVYHLTVWPKRYPLPRDFWASKPALGPAKGRPWDAPDPMRTIGVRPYRPGDPVRQVAPYASARLSALMVRQLEPVTERSVEVLLHPKTADHHWHGIDRQLLEEAISITASVVESAIQQNLACGLSSTGSVPGHAHGFTLTAERWKNADELLTALAWMQPSGTMDDDLPYLLSQLRRRLRPGASLVIVSPYWPETLTEGLAEIAQRRLPVIFLTLGDRRPQVPDWVHQIWRFQEGSWSDA